MEVWTILVMLVLVLAIGLFVVLTFITESSNSKRQQNNILYPFSGQLAPSPSTWTVNSNNIPPGAVGSEPGDGLSLVGSAGGVGDTVPQIQCPVGTKINIVGAFLDIVDPYGECSNTANSTLLATCGEGSDGSSAATCTQDSDCSDTMKCHKGKCVPKTSCGNTCPSDRGTSCSSSSDCGLGLACSNGICQVDPGVNGSCVTDSCASQPTCANVSPPGLNEGLSETCSPSGANDQYQCRPRDASAYLASYCNGKQSCLVGGSDVWLPNTQGGMFGPLPCHVSVPATNQSPTATNTSIYSTLPITMGWNGGAPPNGNPQDPTGPTFNQGYYVHGIYTCIPNDE